MNHSVRPTLTPHPAPSVLLIEDEIFTDLELYRREILVAAPDAQVATATNLAAALASPGDATVLMGKAHSIPAELLAHLPQLEWIHSLTTGVDRVLAAGPRKEIVITCARGIHSPQMTELAMLLMMSLLRNFPQMLRNQAAHRWDKQPQPLLLGKTLGIVGVGTIARELAQRCQAFGMRVLGVSDGQTSAPGFDAIRPRAELVRIAAQVDILLLLVPLTPATRQLVNAEVLAALRPESYLVNLARGPVVDEAALIDALRAQRIAGAALDVFDIEPLPADHPLWSLPNVIVTSHVGGLSTIYGQQNLPIIAENMRAWVSGDLVAMRNLIER
jgi:phosphoglycerate dehydrogenase-like enzyme